MLVRLTVSATGWVLIGVGVALLLRAGLGVAPYDVFTSGLANTTGLAVGTASWLAAAGAVTVAWLLGTRPGWGTIAAAIVVGACINLTLNLVGPLDTNLTVAIAAAAGGLLVLLTGATLTVAGHLGAGAIELLMLALAGSRHIAGGHLGITRARWALEASLCAAGWLLGGEIGIWTLVAVAASGPILGAAIPRVERLIGTAPDSTNEGDLTGR